MSIKKFIKSGKFLWVLFFLVLITSNYLKIVPVLNYNFPFTMDQARDMLDIREIVIGLHPTLIGPTTSINGVFLGPGYYYFNVLPFFFSAGDPAALVYWNILWYAIGAIAIFYFFLKKEPIFAIISSSVFLMSPEFFYSSRFFWSANPMPYVTAIYFLSLIFFVLRRDLRSSLLAGFIAGLSMQFEAAFGVLFFPFLVIFSLIRRVALKILAVSFAGFFVTLGPQVLFELRHGFGMTKTFINEITGNSAILGEKVGFFEAQISHFESFIQFMTGIFEVPIILSYLLIAASAGFLILRIKKLSAIKKEVFLASSLFIVFAYIFYSWYQHDLKGWYLLGLRVPYIFIIALFLSEIFKLKNLAFKGIVLGLITFSFVSTFFSQAKFIPENSSVRSGDKSNLRNEIEAIDWVYQKANGQGFRAYNYIPSVYDFPYQYLYWWHGTKKYGYQPEAVTYLDGVPEYIKENDKFFTKKKPLGASPLIFLIYEKDESPDRLAAWLGSFTKYCTIEKQSFDWGTTVESRKICP